MAEDLDRLQQLSCQINDQYRLSNARSRRQVWTVRGLYVYRWSYCVSISLKNGTIQLDVTHSCSSILNILILPTVIILKSQNRSKNVMVFKKYKINKF